MYTLVAVSTKKPLSIYTVKLNLLGYYVDTSLSCCPRKKGRANSAGEYYLTKHPGCTHKNFPVETQDIIIDDSHVALNDISKCLNN